MLYTVSHLTFACYSAVCRPPGKNGGTGGSLKGGPHDSPISPAARKAMRALKGEADALADEVSDPDTFNRFDADGVAEIDRLEPRVTAFGQKVHAALEKVLAEDEELAAAVQRVEEGRKAATDADEAYRTAFRRRSELFKVSEGRKRTDEEQAEMDRLDAQMPDLSHAMFYQRPSELAALKRAMIERRASVIGQALNEIVPMGGEVAGIGAHRPRKDRFGKVGLTVNEAMTFAAKVYPKSWIEMSNDFATQPHDRDRDPSDSSRLYSMRPLVFAKSQSRAHYKYGKVPTSTVMSNYKGKRVPVSSSSGLLDFRGNPAKEVWASIVRHDEITLDNDLGTAVHEYAHRMEDMYPAVRRLERSFIERRSGTKQAVPLGKGYGSDEVHLPDSLFHRYAEKVYDDGMGEVMSMGWEYYVTGKTSSDRTSGALPDPDHMGLVLGAITTVRRSTKSRKFTQR